MTASSQSQLVVGLQPVREAIRIHRSAIRGLCLEARDNPRIQALERFAKDQGIEEVQKLPRAQLDRLANGMRP